MLLKQSAEYFFSENVICFNKYYVVEVLKGCHGTEVLKV